MQYALSSRHQSFRRRIAVVALLAFSTLALLGLSYSMHMEEQGMSHCAFMSEQASVCPMTVFDHIATWQHMITGLTVLSVVSIAFTVLAVPMLPNVATVQLARRRRLREHSPSIVFHRFLPQLFANGILHSRKYA